MTFYTDTLRPQILVDSKVATSVFIRLVVIAGLVFAFFIDAISGPQALAWGVFFGSVRIFRPISLLNVIIAYWFISFVLTAPVLVPMYTDKLCLHFAGIQSCITAGYWLRRLVKAKTPKPILPPASPTVRARFHTAWFVVAGIGFASILTQIALAGPTEWFTGAVLAAQMENYANGSAAETVSRLLTWVVNWTLLVLFVFHRVHRVPMGYFSFLAAWIGLPMIALARALLFYNALFVLFTHKIRLWMVFLGIGVVAAALFIGFLRASHLQTLDPYDAVGFVFSGEFSSAVAYSDVVVSESHIEKQWGVPIVVPVVLAVVPRFAYPDKPLNGAGIYMQQFQPGLLERGYSAAINPLTDSYISFGFWGMIAFAIAFGWLYSSVDRNIELRRISVLDYLLMFNCYLIMRNALAVPLTQILIQLILYLVISRVLSYSGRPQRNIAARNHRP